MLVPSADGSVNPTVKVAHSCDATPIEYNVTLKMGLHSGVFQKIGKVDSMDDCIEMSCKQSNSDVAFMLGSMCFAVHCYSDDLCKTVPIFGSSISRLNLNPAISFLKKKSRFRVNSLGKYCPLRYMKSGTQSSYFSITFIERCLRIHGSPKPMM